MSEWDDLYEACGTLRHACDKGSDTALYDALDALRQVLAELDVPAQRLWRVVSDHGRPVEDAGTRYRDNDGTWEVLVPIGGWVPASHSREAMELEQGIAFDEVAPPQASRVWRVAAAPDGTSAFVGFRYRQRGETWEIQLDNGAWAPSSYASADDMRAAGFVLAEATAAAGEDR